MHHAMHSSKTWTTKDASIRTANDPQFTRFHAQHIPNAPMPVRQDSIARVPLRRRKPT